MLLRDGRVAEIGRIPPTPGVETLDATGLIVSPGFIDIHSHSDFTLFVDPRAVSSVTQGVTLEVVGNCGHGCAPVIDREAVKPNIYGYQAGSDIPWNSVGEYLDALQSRRPAVNVATLVPNGNLRLAIVGREERAATPRELARMKELLAEGLDQGAFGYSTGLEYCFERESSEEEVIELCGVAARAGAFYATHTRNRYGEARETIEEAIRAGRASKAPLQISHISSVSRLSDRRRWAVEQAVEQVDAARRQGMDVAFDMHTRLFGMTNLTAALPPWALDGTTQEIIARLSSKTTRERIKSHKSIVTALAGDDWSRMVVYNCTRRPELSRRTLAELCKEWGVDPFEAICDILVSHAEAMHDVLVLGYVYRADETHWVFDHPQCMVGSDATTMAADHRLSGGLLHGAFTWAAWFYRHFVTDTRRMSAQEAVRRLTSLPASRVGLRDRGVLRAGAHADVAIFDPTTFAERGTDFEPDRIATGMRHVLVNGEFAVRDGSLTVNRPGRVLRRA